MSDYTSVAKLKTALGISGTTDDLEIGLAIQAASEMIDKETGTRFWVPASAETRYYTALTSTHVVVDDIPSTLSGVAPTVTIALDENADGTCETTIAGTDYVLMPRNAAVSGTPYTSFRMAIDGDYSFPLHEDAVSVSARFGYSDVVPPEIERACLIQAIRLFKRRDSPFGVSGTNNFGQLQIIPALDPDVKLLIAPFKRLRMGSLP